jgi:hypothetical protein
VITYILDGNGNPNIILVAQNIFTKGQGEIEARLEAPYLVLTLLNK